MNKRFSIIALLLILVVYVAQGQDIAHAPARDVAEQEALFFDGEVPIWGYRTW